MLPYLFDCERHPFSSGCFAGFLCVSVFVSLLTFLPTIP